MIDSWSVLSLLRDFYAPPESDDELFSLCEASAAELSAGMKETADPCDIRLVGAAAALANYRLCRRRSCSGQEITSFKAGDVSVSISGDDAVKLAEKSRDDALVKACPLLRDEGFYFGKVNIWI